MALSDFMPYGAPELLEAAPERMARSTMVASLFVAVLVASLGTLTSRQVSLVIEPAVDPIARDWVDLREQSPPSTIPPEVKIAPPKGEPDDHSLVVPKSDDLVPPSDFKELVPANGGTGDGPAEDRLPVAPEFCVCADPQPNEFVYTDQMPAIARAVEPRYPDLAREAGVEGAVTVQMLVGLDGRVLRAIIAPRGSVPMLDSAALEAARASVFTPALANGHPVKVWVMQQYRFRLH